MIEDILTSAHQVVRRWYLPLVIGVILLILGVWTLFTPAKSYVALVIVFAIGFLINGILETYFAIVNKTNGWSLALGILSLILGLMLLFNPALSAITLPLYVGFMLMFRSVSGIAIALHLRRHYVIDWGTLMVFSVLGILLSFLMIFNPAFGGLSIVLWTGFAFLASGALSIVFALRLRKLHTFIQKELE